MLNSSFFVELIVFRRFNLFIIYLEPKNAQEYMLRAEFRLPSITSEEATPERKAPIRVKFEIPYFTVSGIQVLVPKWSFLLRCIVQFLCAKILSNFHPSQWRIFPNTLKSLTIDQTGLRFITLVKREKEILSNKKFPKINGTDA